MSYRAVFKRYELKYLITLEQKERVVRAIEPYMTLDEYGRSSIRNIYFDTADYRLIRRSIEKPLYKEKLRIRSYGPALPESSVFVELKKKYRSVVYKRRISMPEADAVKWLAGDMACPDKSQISAEIAYFLEFYGDLRPTVFLSYEREAYYCAQEDSFRVTFDDSILCRTEQLSLGAELYGTPILPEGMVLMEIKCSGGIPLWMTRLLTEENIFKTSFSKYGEAYKKLIFPKLKEALCYA